MLLKKFSNYKEILLYALAMATFILLLEFLKYKFYFVLHRFEIYASLIAFLFTGLGIWLAKKVTSPKLETLIIKKEVTVEKSEFALNVNEMERLRISKRELEVLDLMAKGLSNQEIADTLFVSLATVKTHSSNLFEKLDVKRRTQAVEKAKQIQLIP